MVTNRFCRPGLFLLALGVAPPALSDPTDTRHGTVEESGTPIPLEGGFTTTWQHAGRSGIHDEAGVSIDLVATLPMGSGTWTLYLEGSTTPGKEGVTSRLPEVNADIGTALNAKGKGRLQISELHYSLLLPVGELTLGLLDPAGFLDRSEVANDETRQFLAAPFVNNPTIGLPDYHLAVAWHHHATENRPGITLELGSAHGLADNGGRYAELVRLGADGKGVFFAAEGYGHLRRVLWRLGFWVNGADHPPLDGSGRPGHAHGFYATLDGELERLRWNLRGGWADARVSAATTFAALAVEHPLPGVTLGAGFAYTGASPELEGGADRLQLEGYARFETRSGLEITPDIQWVRHSDLRKEAGNTWVAGVRLTWSF